MADDQPLPQVCVRRWTCLIRYSDGSTVRYLLTLACILHPLVRYLIESLQHHPHKLLELDEGDAEVFGLAMHPSRDLLALGLVDGRTLLYAYEGMGETCTLAAALRSVFFRRLAHATGLQNRRPIRF